MSRSVVLAGLAFLAMLLSLFSVPSVVEVAEAQEPFILNVSVQDEMKTRNPMFVTFFTTDVWTADVIGPIIEGTVQEHPETLARLPYVMVGTDVNGNGALDADEVGVFQRETPNPDFWTAFYDLRGVRFHDGTQVEMEDILVNYHFEALAPGGERFYTDLAGGPGSNYSADRWIWVNPVPVTNASTTGWAGGAVTDPAHQFAIRIKQTGPNAGFDRTTLQTVLIPAYFWQGTGWRDRARTVPINHPDFGWALNPETLNGVPAAGATLSDGTVLKPFDIVAAGEWEAQDGDVIGSGPFKFVTWLPGQVARIEKNADYFVPDPSLYPAGAARAAIQATLDAGLRVPALDAIVYRLFRNVQAGVFALQAGEVDFLDWFVPPEFVGPLLGDPNIGIITASDAGYFYLAYNMRRLPFGYVDPVQGSNIPDNDIGLPFRQAVSHAIDKRTIVTALLQNFGVAGHTVVSPTNTLYYNASAPRYEFDLDLAASILDAAYGPDPPGECTRDGSGCRDLPGKGTSLFEILTPQADYDPIRAAAGTLISQNLRKIGINVDSRPTAFGTIVTKFRDEQDVDMWILGWSLTGFIRPTYIELFYHSRHIDPGDLNSYGYINQTFDQIVDAATGAATEAEGIRLWMEAQSVVATDLPADVLYFRQSIYAFRADRIDPASWRLDIGGDPYYFWSRILLDPAPAGLIRTSATAPSALASGGTANIVVTVRDAEGNRLSGATVSLAVTSGVGTGSVSPDMGTTDANGQFQATFTGPDLSPGALEVASFVEIQTVHPQLGDARPISVVLTTFPPGVSFLTLLVDTPFGNAVDEGATTVLDISIADETGLAAAGTSVVLTPTPTATLEPSTFTTGVSGRQSVTFTAPPVDADTPFTITIDANRQGVTGQATLTLRVLDIPPAPAAPISGELVLIIVGVVGVGAAGGVYAWWRRRR